jgi:pSer/pThr/pTyr-binding forkhead associated (FHA) protein
MPHITLLKKSTAKPGLEFYSDGSGEARRVTIEAVPFRIGRSEAADLRVDAVEVSREHAEIIERNGAWLVRDLGSTNGTQVNGKPIKEALLADGDNLRIAETELTFIASAATQFQRMVTQPMQVKKQSTAANVLPSEIEATRMLMEATLWQAIQPQLLDAKSLEHGGTEALFAARGESAHQSLLDQPYFVCEHYRELERLIVLELACERSDTNRLFLPVGPSEIESPHRLFLTLKQLKELLPVNWDLGITISLSIEVDVVRNGDVHRQARDQGILVAFDEFQGNGGQVMHLESLLPDYLVLAGNMTKDLIANRQALRRLESLWGACQELGIKPVLPQGDSVQALALCREIGFNLMLQSPGGVTKTAQQNFRLTADDLQL